MNPEGFANRRQNAPAGTYEPLMRVPNASIDGYRAGPAFTPHPSSKRDNAVFIDCDKLNKENLWTMLDKALATHRDGEEFPLIMTNNYETRKQLYARYLCDMYERRGWPTMARIRQRRETGGTSNA